MNTRVFVASAVALAVLAPVSANALTISNKDQLSYTLKVTPKDGKAMDVAVKANGDTVIDCKMGCTLSLAKQTDKVDASASKVTIKDGKLVM